MQSEHEASPSPQHVRRVQELEQNGIGHPELLRLNKVSFALTGYHKEASQKLSTSTRTALCSCLSQVPLLVSIEFQQEKVLFDASADRAQ
jgi:hypothetical protein